VCLLLSRSWVAMTAADWILTATTGLFLFGVYNIALNAGTGRVDAGTAAFVSQVAPVFIALLAALFLRERVSVRALLGMALAFGGVATIALGSSSGHGHGDVLGVVLCVVSALAYAVSAVLEKPLVARLPALQITWVACTVGGLLCLPFWGSLREDLSAAPAADLGWLLFLGVGPTAAAFTTFAYALRHMRASALGVTTYLIPPLTVALSWVMLSETPPAAAYAGGVLSLVGVAVATSRSSR
jgi:drug/metabolite transporter (DMT)-like permease